jgi:hypothetical protein
MTDCYHLFKTGFSINYRGEEWKQPFEATMPFQDTFPDVMVPTLPRPTDSIAEWGKWHLIIEGTAYYSRFSDRQEWSDYYQWLYRNNLTDSLNFLYQFKAER